MDVAKRKNGIHALIHYQPVLSGMSWWVAESNARYLSPRVGCGLPLAQLYRTGHAVFIGCP